MLKIIILSLLLYFLSGCLATDSSNNYNTPSSSSSSSSSSMSSSDGGSSLSSSSNSSDDNSTIYDPVDAIYDPNACLSSKYSTVNDASYSGVNPGENGSDYFEVPLSGLSIRSDYLVSSPSENAKTWVTLYYHTFPDINFLGEQGRTTYTKENEFSLNFDRAWSDQNIPNVDNILYVRTNSHPKQFCYRTTLDNIEGENITVIKVYR